MVRVMLMSHPWVPQEDVDSPYLLTWVILFSSKGLGDGHLP